MPGEVGQPVVKHVTVQWLHEKEHVIIQSLETAANRVNPKMLRKPRLTVINLVKVSSKLAIYLNN